MPTALKVALFDLDATLTDHSAALARWAEEFAQENDIPLAWLQEADQRNATRHGFFADIKATFGKTTSILAMHADYRRRSAELVPHRPDICAAIKSLTDDGWALGVVTNGSPTTQRTKLEVSQLDTYFNSTVISGEIGPRKPSRALFLLALDELHAGPDTWAVMVGDQLATDIVGGTRAGLRTVWVADGQVLRADDPAPTHTVQTVIEAVEWLHTAPALDRTEFDLSDSAGR
ncbi:HAD family hydrolase [Streptomyces sp. NBC_01411]|uniref:HAD family hydrolase n=1 Tax=Streptomyces sp. NBC_01411 TaxID=2903857 RepID=UPI003253D6D2